MSRTVNKEKLFGKLEKETFRRHIWQVADGCGVEVLTYTVMSNHFHVLVRVPRAGPIEVDELLRRYEVMHPQPTRYQAKRLDVIKGWLRQGDPRGEEWRKKQEALMGDLAVFMKLLKQRFSIWFNHQHNRVGTLWMGRYTSVLVQDGTALETMATYIDLNSVRAKLVRDPAEYRFCGYAEALAGSALAREGLIKVFGGQWQEVCEGYRQRLFGVAAGDGSISEASHREVMQALGKLSVAQVLCHRVRYLTDGAVLGSHAFVAEQLAKHRKVYGRTRRLDPKPLGGIIGWEELRVFRGLNGPVIV
jgi:putative transposase